MLAINTTGQSVQFNGSMVAPGFALDITGTVDFLGFAQASGFADITIGPSGFQIMFGLSFSIGSLNFTANGGAGVYSDGIALDLQVSLNANAEVFSITASGTLQINTTNQTELGIAPGSFYLAVSGSVDILKVFDFNASMTIYVGPDPEYRSERATGRSTPTRTSASSGSRPWAARSSSTSDGNFQISLSGQIMLGTSDFRAGRPVQHLRPIDGARPATGYTFEPRGSASVSLNVFGISLARPRRRASTSRHRARARCRSRSASTSHPLPVLDDQQDRQLHDRLPAAPDHRVPRRRRGQSPGRCQHGQLPAADVERSGRQPTAAVPERRQSRRSTATSAATGRGQLRDLAGRRHERRRHHPGERVRPPGDLPARLEHRRRLVVAGLQRERSLQRDRPGRPQRHRARKHHRRHRRIQRQHRSSTRATTTRRRSPAAARATTSSPRARRTSRSSATPAASLTQTPSTSSGTRVAPARRTSPPAPGTGSSSAAARATRSRSATATTRSPGRPARSRWGPGQTSST